jgi:hypothetical protein
MDEVARPGVRAGSADNAVRQASTDAFGPHNHFCRVIEELDHRSVHFRIANVRRDASVEVAFRIPAANSLDHDHGWRAGKVGVPFMVLEAAQLCRVTLAVRVRRHGLEPGVPERQSQCTQVVQELVSPPVKGAVHFEATPQLLIRAHFRGMLVMGQPDPVEVRSRNPQNAMRPKDATTLVQEHVALRQCEVLEEVFGEDEVDVVERQSATYIQRAVNAISRSDVDVDPSLEWRAT